MHDTEIQREQIAALSVLAAGIIPADHRDGGANSVDAGSRIAERIRFSLSRSLYNDGLSLAVRLAKEKFEKQLNDLDSGEITLLLDSVREQHLAFFRQLRSDTCAIYLSDPAVWQRIGFPGPSAASGGYPNFDQPQVANVLTKIEGISDA